MEPVALAPAGSGDAAALFDLFYRARGHDLGAAFWPEAVRDATLRIQFEAQRRGYAEHFPSATTSFLVRRGDRVGWLIVDRSPGAIRVVDIAIVPELRGQGFGSFVLRALQDEAARAGVPITLNVQRINVPAIRLYSRLGFEAAGADDLQLHLQWRPVPSPAAVPEYSAEMFRGALDSWFEVAIEGPPLLLLLKDVTEGATSGGFTRFSLIFRGPADRLLPQGLYMLRNPVVGDREIFLVPVAGSTPERIVYEACFSVPERGQAT
jgi:GNAT superfamily N-acetyltransferase